VKHNFVLNLIGPNNTLVSKCWS